MTTAEFNQEIVSLDIDFESMAAITGISVRSLYSYRSGERRVPPWMPFVLRMLRVHLKPDNRNDN